MGILHGFHLFISNSNWRQFHKVEYGEKRFFVWCGKMHRWDRKLPKMIGAERWTPYLYSIRFNFYCLDLRGRTVFFFQCTENAQSMTICTSLNRPLILYEISLTHVDYCFFSFVYWRNTVPSSKHHFEGYFFLHTRQFGIFFSFTDTFARDKILFMIKGPIFDSLQLTIGFIFNMSTQSWIHF